MDDSGESQALLMKDYTSENEPYRGDGSSTGDESCRSDGWWDGTGSESTCSTSYCSDSDSLVESELEWESKVSPRGELFYVESRPVEEAGVGKQPAEQETALEKTEGPKPRKRHSTKGKLARLIRRRNSKRQRNKLKCIVGEAQPSQQLAEEGAKGSCSNRSTLPDVVGRVAGGSKVTFQDWQEGETREVTLNVDPRVRHNLGRRATLCEALLGLVVSTFSDETRIMVAGFIPNGEALNHRSIKIGDWLRGVDGKDVTIATIDSVLANITSPRKVELKLQRVVACEVSADDPAHNHARRGRQSELVRQLVGAAAEGELTSVLRGLPVGVVYLTQEGLTEGGPPDQGVLYCYPVPAALNLLATVRGLFLTLQHLLPSLAASAPVSSTILLRGLLTHVVYTSQGPELLLLAVPHNRCSAKEAVLLSADLVRNLQFNYQSLSWAFCEGEHRPALDHFFSLFFARLLSSGLWPDAQQSVFLEEIATRATRRAPAQFEDLLPAAHWVPLPRDVQVQIDEALSELEANDFGDRGDIHSSQRLYTIIGSSVYHKGYLLASHLSRADLVDVHTFCRQQGLLHLGRTEPVHSLVLWREVFPASCNRGMEDLSRPPVSGPNSPYQPPRGRWYLLIVGQGQEMLVVLLEAGGCSVRAEGHRGPDVFYVEQAQNTLAYIQKCGVHTVAAKWTSVSIRPEVITPETAPVTKVSPRRADNFLGFVRSSEPSTPTKLASVTGTVGPGGSPVGKRTPEVTSILKRRGSPDRYAMSGYSLQGSTSEDSASQAASVISEVSDEAAPILGRRAERERHRGSQANVSRLTDSASEHSDDSDSDWGSYKNHSRQSGCDLSDVKQALLTNVENIFPTKLSAGEHNTVFHYVHLDLTEGVLLCPATNREQVGSHRMTEILHCFRSCCQDIHALLQNAVRFKKLVTPGLMKASFNRSLVAVKEHGMLFECTPSAADSKKTGVSLAYWVVGRLFFTPCPREVYVCYHDSAPQNMVEIAFRLGLSTSG